MGYSVYVEAKNEDLQEKMYGFLDKNLKNFCKELYDYEGGTALRIAKGGKGGLSYCNDDLKYPIGFDYGPIDVAERVYAYEIIKWMVSKISDKRFYYYDHELTSVQDQTPQAMLDFLKMHSGLNRRQVKQAVKFIVTEISRLNDLWDRCFFYRKYGDYHNHEVCDNCPWAESDNCPEYKRVNTTGDGNADRRTKK